MNFHSNPILVSDFLFVILNKELAKMNVRANSLTSRIEIKNPFSKARSAWAQLKLSLYYNNATNNRKAFQLLRRWQHLPHNARWKPTTMKATGLKKENLSFSSFKLRFTISHRQLCVTDDKEERTRGRAMKQMESSIDLKKCKIQFFFLQIFLSALVQDELSLWITFPQSSTYLLTYLLTIYYA